MKLHESEGHKEYCQSRGQRTLHVFIKDEQRELWKVCEKCKKREYVGTK